VRGGSSPSIPTNHFKYKKEIKMTFIIGLIVGAFVGWNIPQPSFAKTIQEKICNKIKNR
jgi:Na+/H+-dicarboxylate symporter